MLLDEERLKLCDIKDISTLTILEKNEKYQIIQEGEWNYLIVKRKFPNAKKQKIDKF